LDLIYIECSKKTKINTNNGKMKIKIIATFVFSTLLFSCESNTYNEISKQNTNPTYAADIKPIIDNNCITCHSSSGGQTPHLTTYEEVKGACLNNNLVCRIEGESCGAVMPQGARMPQPNIDLIKLWVTNGFVKE